MHGHGKLVSAFKVQVRMISFNFTFESSNNFLLCWTVPYHPPHEFAQFPKYKKKKGFIPYVRSKI